MQSIKQQLQATQTMQDLENLKIQVIGKKGVLTLAFAQLKDLEGEQKRIKAQEINLLKSEFESLYEVKKQELQTLELAKKLQKEQIDVSLFTQNKFGKTHYIHLMIEKIIDYFSLLNFELCEGQLLEDDFHNFEALNIPKFHPARDMQDTFYTKDQKVLRTHTSPVQIHTMLAKKPPLKMIAPGAVFRRDYDLTHSPMFHQVEGLVVDEKGVVSFSHLKYILQDFLKSIFGDVGVRFRSSFFPFTEPSAEVDMSCVFCHGAGCRVCSHTGWLEVLGCGMVNDNVFKAVGYENVSGYAFGLGVERFAMLHYGINDLRGFFEVDLRN
ncbi:phenylalanine--tRNA ligase subunit alpha [Helicobacter cholecystus]|uniref:Phenylalanine--tRNA ligase alpha subunit n=1 Tax=Helicobacter cholecystus TaxID=45498 RepID=A0A3D8ISJ5_9HELI|nr:phenylalanine--tRNA ligase subunit alpha [Helicobacter cholecystus]RDU68172.1 phenylalanine--tRNA ligase subunit alpha [Helicobacter cholecystus]VEJ26031.1 phenylalanyl-tRNA synthetase subunit alpha [Helicobacter cholecystus]